MSKPLSPRLSKSARDRISAKFGGDAELMTALLEILLPMIPAALSPTEEKGRAKQERGAWGRIRRALDTLNRDLSRPEIDARLSQAGWGDPEDWRTWKLALPRLRSYSSRQTGRRPEAFRMAIGQSVAVAFLLVGIRLTKSRNGGLARAFRVMCEELNVATPADWEMETLGEIIHRGKAALREYLQDPTFRAAFSKSRYGRRRPLVMDEFLSPSGGGGKSTRKFPKR